MPKNVVVSNLKKKPTSERILAFDILRGFFLLVILFNHLDLYPSGLDFFTGRSILYVSTAEGFFVVSGIVLGIVRGQKLLKLPFWTGATLLWKRALQLYITSIILTFLFTLVGQFFIGNPGLKWGIFTDWSHWWQLIIHTLNLSYTYGWADFLRLYALFIFAAPLALWLLRKGLWYVVLIASGIIWALYPLLPNDPVIAQPFSWQFIFFAGFVIGFYWDTILAKWRSLSLVTRKKIGRAFIFTFACTYVAVFILVFSQFFDGPIAQALTTAHHGIEQGFNKDRLNIPRILLGTIWFWGLFSFIRRYEALIVKKAGWLLLSFGANSLYVYTISAFVVFFMHLIVNPQTFDFFLPNLIVSFIGLGLVYLAVRTKFLMNIIPR